MRQITAKELSELLKAGEHVYLLDVREQWEHDTASIPGSVLVPLNEITKRSDEIEPPEGALVVAYCHHGVRSLSAASILEHQLGFENVASLSGGIDAWSQVIDPKVPRY
ncbi:MAG: rhodanese-like domain-containing protein [Bdellovibrionota bacterium]